MRIGIILAAGMAVFGAGCGNAPRENVVLRTTAGSDTLILSESILTTSGNEQHEMILRFNNRKIADTATDKSDYDVKMKLSPEKVRIYKMSNKEAVARAMAVPWNVYVSPKSFDDKDFAGIATAYEANRAQIDDALLKPPFTTKRYIERFVHAELPMPPAQK